jgi:hypothetical protein
MKTSFKKQVTRLCRRVAVNSISTHRVVINCLSTVGEKTLFHVPFHTLLILPAMIWRVLLTDVEMNSISISRRGDEFHLHRNHCEFKVAAGSIEVLNSCEHAIC